MPTRDGSPTSSGARGSVEAVGAEEPEAEAVEVEIEESDEADEEEVVRICGGGRGRRGARRGAAPSSRDRDDDVLEETPDFLEEAPEDDQLWFEQKPPKDFDFDD